MATLPTASSNRPAQSKLGALLLHSHFLVPGLLLAVYLTQCLWFIETQSLTYDEPVHIVEGLDAWRHGRFEQFNDHPPLARLLCALPLLRGKWNVQIQQYPNSFAATSITPDPEALAHRARAVNVGLGVLLAILVWGAARRMLSDAAANFALAFYVFCPALIAHFSLATTDGAATLTIFATAVLVTRWRRELSWPKTLALGIVFGLLLLAKFSTIVIFGLGLGWLLVSRGNSRRQWAKAFGAAIVALMAVWAGYFFHTSHLSIANGTLTATFPNWTQNIVKPVHSRLNLHLIVPAGEYVEGFRTLMRHNNTGQASFFLGRVSKTGGWKLYYPVVMLLKWPLVILLLCVAGTIFVVRGRLRMSKDAWVMTSFPALYLLLAIFARFNIGERHILPLYPFAFLLLAKLWETAREKPAVRVLLLGLALLNSGDCLHSAPGYLSYMDPAVRPAERYLYLTDSNLDWGHGLLALRDFERKHPTEPASLAYFGSVEPRIYGIKAAALGEHQRTSGTIVVSATNLSGQFLSDPAGYRWLLQFGPPQILDGSLYVFQVSDTTEAVSRKFQVCGRLGPGTLPCR